MVSARITSKGQVTIPKRVRERLGLRPGDRLEFHFEQDRLEVRPVHRRSIEEFRGLFAVDHALDFSEERRLAWEARMSELAGDNANDDA